MSKQNTGNDSNWQARFPLSRRDVLVGATALGLAGGVGTVSTTGSASESPCENPEGPWQDYDHSGDALGRCSSLESVRSKEIIVEDLISEGTPIVDVRGYGVVGDGETDDAAAFQAAVDAATPHGVLFVPSEVNLHFENPIDVDLGLSNEEVVEPLGNPPQTRFAFRCEGTLNPAPGLGDAVHIHHGVFPYVNVRIEGGGKDVETDNGIRVSDMVGGYFEGYASDYAGTVYKFDNGETRSQVLSIGTIQTNLCGQSLLMKAGPDGALPILGGIGEIGNIWDIGPVRSPEFHNVFDLNLNQYENVVIGGRTKKGMLFDQCGSLWLDKIAVGGNADIPLVEFSLCIFAHANSIFATHVPNTGVVIDTVANADFRILAFDNDVGVEYKQTRDGLMANNRVYVNAFRNAKEGVVVRDSIAEGFHQFTGHVTENGKPMRIQATAPDRIHLDSINITANEGDAQLVVPDGENPIRISDSYVPTIAGNPKAVDNVGQASAAANLPDAAEWGIGDIVSFTDSDDGSGDGVYLQLPDGTWSRIGDN